MLYRIGAAALTILTPASAWAGDLVLVGGSWQWPATNDPYGISIYQEIVELAGGPEAAKIGIFTTASSSAASAQANGSLYVEDFQDLYQEYYPNREPDVEWIPLQIDNCSTTKNDPAIALQINSRNAFVFGGGDQSLITECFFNENPATETRTTTPVFEALKNKFKTAVIAGTSAGTSVQTGVPMITEGESYEAILKGANPLVGSPPFVSELYYNPLGGFGFFPYGLTDTHFSARGRQGRTIRLAADLDMPMVFGIDENTALVVRDVGNQAEMTVLGEQGVSIFDLSEATVNEDDWSISDVFMTYLTAGDRYDPLTKTATFPQKTVSDCAGETIPTSTDIFSAATGDRQNPSEFINVALDLAASCATTATGRSAQTDPVVQVTMSDESATSYVGLDSQGIKKQSFVNLTVDIKRKVPEPSTVGMIGMGILGMLWRRKYP